jgi:uncharacterized membrane protein HdeD (DUF308 family)
MAPWLKVLTLGVLSLVAGAFALGNAVAASVAVTIFTGLLFLAVGAVQVLGALSAEGLASRAFPLATGALAALIGALFLLNPTQGVISLATLVMLLVGLSGLVRLWFAWKLRATPFFWALLVPGALSVLLAAYVFATPGLTLAVLGLLLGVELVLNGLGFVALSLHLRAAARGR